MAYPPCPICKEKGCICESKITQEDIDIVENSDILDQLYTAYKNQNSHIEKFKQLTKEFIDNKKQGD